MSQNLAGTKMNDTSSLLVDDDLARAKVAARRHKTWQIVFVSLFTSLLAFFILTVTLIDLEGSTVKRNHQKLVHYLYLTVLQEQKTLPWLQVENTLSKGIKLTLDASLFQEYPLFESARAKLNPRFTPYLSELAQLIRHIELEAFPQKYEKLVKQIEASGYDFMITVRVEGHTDSQPLAQTALFTNNIELSTYRAYAMMDLLRIYTGLPKRYFAIAGYGSFYPLVENPQDPINRRVEIYLVPQVLAKREAL